MTELCYGDTATSALVRVDRAFGPSNPFLVGRTAVSTPAGRLITGAGFGITPEAVRRRAFAELVERLSAYAVAHEEGATVKTTPTVHEADRIVAPSSMQHWRPEQELPPEIDRDPDAALRRYRRGVRITTGAPMLVPALCTDLDRPPGETMFAAPGATGLAAGRTRAAAMRRGLLEVIERDACMVAWRLRGSPVRRVLIEPAPALRAACEHLELQLEMFGTSHGRLPVTVIALLFGRGGGGLTVGSACGALVRGTVDHAVAEALALQWTVRDAAPDEVEASSLEPTDSFGHVCAGYVNGPAVRAAFDHVPATAGCSTAVGPHNLRALAMEAEQTFESPVVAVDVTTGVARRSGWHVFRVVVPGALPRESNIRLMNLGGPRLAALSGARYEVCARPHPFG